MILPLCVEYSMRDFLTSAIVRQPCLCDIVHIMKIM